MTVASDGSKACIAYDYYPARIKVFNTEDFSEIKDLYLSTLNNIDAIQLSKNEQILYVLNDRNFYLININDGSVINTVSLNYYSSEFILSPDGQYAYLYSDYSYLQKINLQTLSVTIKNTSSDVTALAISPNGQYLYAGIQYSNLLRVYSAETLNQITSFQISTTYVTDLYVSSNSTHLYVLNRNNPNFEIYDIQTHQQITSITTGSNSYDFDFDVPPPDSIRPQPISDLQIAKVYNEGALLTWTAVSDDSVTEPVKGYEVRYDTVAITDLDSAIIYVHSLKPSAPGEIDSLRITGFQGETKYWIAIRTFDEARNFSDSVVVDFTTMKTPRISVSPDSFNFTVTIGDSIEDSFTVTNAGGTDAGALDYKIIAGVGFDTDHFFYVANYYSRNITEIDLIRSTQRNININISNFRPYKVKKSPISTDLWIADQYSDLLIIFDLSQEMVKNNISMRDVKKILFSADGAFAYLLYDSYSGWVRVYNTENLSVVSNFNISNFYTVSDFAVSPDGSTIYIVAEYDFYTYDAFSGARTNEIRLSYRSEKIEISPDGLYAYLSSDSYLQKIDLRTYYVAHTSLGNQTSSIAVSHDGQRIYAGSEYGNTVAVYNATNLSPISTILTNNDNIIEIKISTDDKQLYVLHQYSPNLAIYNVQTGSHVSSHTTGSQSYSFDVAGTVFPFIKADPISGTIDGGESAQISLIINGKYLSHKRYISNILIESNDPDNPKMTLPVTINTQDKNGPEFTMSFFVNPYLTNNLKVLVFAHEFLEQFPILVVHDSTNLPLAIQDSTFNIYIAKYKLTSDEDVTFSVSGSDSLENIGSFERTLRVKSISLGKTALVSNIDGNLKINFAPNSYEKDMFVILWEDNENEDKQKVYHLEPASILLDNAATIEIDYSKYVRSNSNPCHLSFYRQAGNGQWEKVTTCVDKKRQVLAAKIDRLGTFKIEYDESTFSEEIIVPDKYNLNQNYPNPFNPSTIIYYSLPEAQLVTLKVYNVLGKEVAILVDKPQQPGNYYVNFHAENLASGVYFYQLKAGKFRETRKMILIR